VTRDRDEILLQPPVVRSADTVPAVEDRSYVVFIGGAMVMALGGGFALAVAASLAGAGVAWVERGPWLTQAHGAAQLQGWAGLFVAGMGLRLLPRFAGKKPLPRVANLAVWAPLFAGIALRTVAQPGAGSAWSEVGLLAGQALWAAGALAFSALVLVTLARGRGRGQSWHALAVAGALWWIGWAALSLSAGVRGARHDAFVPPLLGDHIAWIAMLGGVGNFIWAVQGRSVPIFFGRKTPPLRSIAVPAGLLQAGLLLVFAAAWLDPGETATRLYGAGIAAAGAATAWLAPIAGSIWGRPTRLRPRARAAARFVLAANLSAVLCGVLLAWTGARIAFEGEFVAPGVRDAARHAFGAGVVTLLIVGMAQLVAPFFALRRVESTSAWIVDRGVFWLLASAAVLRVATALLQGHVDADARMHLNAGAGMLAWLGLAFFAFMVFEAIRKEPRIKATLAEAAHAAASSRR
jgi:hypothetical protein